VSSVIVSPWIKSLVVNDPTFQRFSMTARGADPTQILHHALGHDLGRY
jgi:hypothetical protein